MPHKQKAMADLNNIQQMVEEDYQQVKEIWQTEAKKAHQPFIPENYWDSKEVVDNFKREIKNPKNERYVYKNNERKIKGFIIAYPYIQLSKAYIAEMYIDSNSQNKGIGTAFFKTLQGENHKFPQLKGKYKQFTSHVYVHNSISISWHIKNNFKITGIHFCPKTGLPKLAMRWEKITKELEECKK